MNLFKRLKKNRSEVSDNELVYFFYNYLRNMDLIFKSTKEYTMLAEVYERFVGYVAQYQAEEEDYKQITEDCIRTIQSDSISFYVGGSDDESMQRI